MPSWKDLTQGPKPELGCEHLENIGPCILMAEADSARNVVSMGHVFCNFKTPYGGFCLRPAWMIINKYVRNSMQHACIALRL